MRTTETPTYWARIYVAHDPDCRELARSICQIYADKVGLCVTVTETEFVYTGGREPGVIVGFINYPRFPSTPAVIRSRALELAEQLKNWLSQKRVSVEFPDMTVMLGDPDA